MSPLAIGALVLALTFSGVLAGFWLHSSLPEPHLNSDSKDTVRLGIGLLATMTALVLGLVTASAKSSFDTLDTAIKLTAAEVLTLDRTLARYGPESEMARTALYEIVIAARNHSWPAKTPSATEMQPSEPVRGAENVVKYIRSLSEQNDDQRWLKTRALDLSENLLEARWVVFSNTGSSIPVPFLVVLVFWLTVIFVSFGLFAPKNGTVISILFVCAVSVASAIFLILEMDGPFTGVIRVSPVPLDYALTRINQ